MERSPARPPPGVSPLFWSFLAGERLEGKTLLDVGTGTGRIALALAPRCGRVVGLDRDAASLEEARGRAKRAGITNATFEVADVETIDYATWAPDLVVAHLYMSSALVERAARTLPGGGLLAVVAFHVDQWRETGRVSRFAYDEERMRTLLKNHGLTVERLELEREERAFASVEEALAAVVGLEDRWRSDGRWFRYIKFLEDGGRTLTGSHLLVKARRP
jgi:ubiquinone/menaquinone biosynthesis C-methylase UbiE